MKKLFKSIYNYVKWGRTNPSILDPNWVTYLSLKNALVDFVNIYVKEGDAVLDFWCWNMIYKKFFTKKWVKKYVGIDIGDSPEFNKNYIVYWWGTLPIWDNEFDISLSTQVFEHLDDPLLYGQELERVTKKWWYLFITIAHVWTYHPYPKHYYNIFLDAIPLIFKNSEIVNVAWDTTNVQNSLQMLSVALYKKNIFLWVLVALFFNVIIYLSNKLNLSNIKPVDYLENWMAWNILVVLKVNK